MANDDPKAANSWMPAGLGYADDLIPKFNRQDKSYSVSKFVQEIEDNGEIFQWTPQQQLVIARRSLAGTAALWLRSERPFKSWDELKHAITKEFPDTLDQKTAHELMSSRKKRHDESYLDYLLIMRELGKRGKMPDYVAIKYIIDGIPGEETHKIMLYGVTTYPDLKEKLRIYETLREKIRKREVRVQPSAADVSTKGRAIRCYSCGEKSYHSKECPHKHLGLKCFKCNGFGHIAPHCNRVTEIAERVPSISRSGPSAGDQSGVSSVRRQQPSFRQVGTSGARPQDGGANGTRRTMFNTEVTSSPADDGSTDAPDCYDVHAVSSLTDDGFDVSTNYQEVKNNNKQVTLRKPRKTINILNTSTSALIDTGSEVNLISQEFYVSIGSPRCEDDPLSLFGLGQAKVRSMGKVFVSVTIDGQIYYDEYAYSTNGELRYGAPASPPYDPPPCERGDRSESLGQMSQRGSGEAWERERPERERERERDREYPSAVMAEHRGFTRRPVARNSNLLSAVLCLVKELDYPGLEVAEMAVRCRMDELANSQ